MHSPKHVQLLQHSFFANKQNSYLGMQFASGFPLTSKMLAKAVVELESTRRATASLRAAVAIGGRVVARTTAIVTKTNPNFFHDSIFNCMCKLIETGLLYIEMPKIF
ncbi:hypothetical protein ERO13_A09G213400v2 [Gossypium hirsutum]|uniref:Uncharacterized protein n=3 Tax=Gossypium TaxID=3633 RepID=A0A5J5UIU2_GOSBA|nr:hypothetical protein ES319_A09G224000v1 [Gossypium barbadense]KAG4185128.1 hypothetical protein ERO13_A09G213400v2 [Gossypium hirsutum]TYH03809.1 hypothetical protein ES288_A09G248500v1 [Gossypium darwinii]TYJ19963.1 hypothetical protein E1A91_A09G228000v1 [Gossypium mustelinum]